MSEVLLEMREITKRFPGVKALDSVSFTAYKGEILSIVGENGAGKSTLMKVLSGHYAYNTYDGQVFVDGKEERFENTSQSEAAGIAMIYQEINMHRELSVAENLFIAHWPRKKNGAVDWRELNRKAAEQLRMLDLNIDPRIPLKNLNTSQMQMISIVRAISQRPKLLVLDEPTSALTETESEKLFQILHRLKSEGITSIFISHKLDEVFTNADRIVVIRDGKVIGTHDVGDTDRRTIISEMVGRSFEAFFPNKTFKPGDEALRVEDITVPHPFISGKNIVDHVSIHVRHGEILGIAGLIGAGRTEFVNAVYGSLKRSSGRIWLDGKELDISKPYDALKNGIVMVTEDRKHDGFVGKLDIISNITLASLEKVSRRGRLLHKKERAYSDHYFKEMDIRAASASVKVATLSGGNQQKVVLSKCLMKDPKVLIMDEPTRGVDIAAKHLIYDLMADLVAKGTAIIMISSELPELIAMSDRVAVFSDGVKTGELQKEDISQINIMELAVANNS